MPTSSQESRRNNLLLADRRVSSAAMLAIIASALICALFGFLFHLLWVVAIVVLALGLGLVIASLRANRREVVEQAQELPISPR